MKVTKHYEGCDLARAMPKSLSSIAEREQARRSQQDHVILKRRSSESRGQARLTYAESRRRKAIASVTEGDLHTTITLDSDQQMRRLGECRIDLHRTDSREVSITPQGK